MTDKTEENDTHQLHTQEDENLKSISSFTIT